MKDIITVSGQDIRISGRLYRIAELEGDGYVFLDDPKPVLEELSRSGKRVDLFTFMQGLRETSPKYPYPMEMDNLAAVPVTTFDQWWNHQIRPEARNRARQAEKKGVVIREVPFDEALVKGIWEIYNETPVRQGRRFPHYGKDLKAVYADEATFLDTSVFVGAFLDEKLIGFVKLTADATWTQANLMNILSLVQHRDKAPTNALVARAIRVCAERGIGYLVYQRYAYGNKQMDGIQKFKEVNGFQRFDLPRYYVPLTLLGNAVLRFQLHHRLVDRLPVGMTTKLRELRDAWYRRRLQTAKEPA